jgi:hypothetical protein
MKIHRSIVMMALIFSVSCSHKGEFRYQTPTGETIILVQTASGGFPDTFMRREYFVQWASGNKERLPTVWFLHELHHPRIVQTNGLVWIISERGLLVRQGSSKATDGAWQQWEIKPNAELFQFLLQYAAANHFEGVTTSSYTQPLRLGPMVVSGSATETNMTLHYAAKPNEFFIAQTEGHGIFLPPHHTSVDFATHAITARFISPPNSMPTNLVFITRDKRFGWVFDKEETERSF